MNDYPHRGIVVIAVNLAESVQTIQPYVEEYPEILFLRDQYEFVWDVYKDSGKLPLIYILDHDMEQNVRLRRESFDLNLVKNTTLNLIAPVSALLDPQTAQVKAGNDLNYNLKVKNWTSEDLIIWVKIDMVGPAGGVLGVYPMQKYTMPPYQLRSMDLVTHVPLGMPAGIYRFRVLIGRPAELMYLEWFDFEVLR